MKSKVFKIIYKSTIAFLLFISICFVGIKQVLDQRLVKDYVKEKIQTFFLLDVEYEEIGSVVFPRPGMKIKGLKILKGEKEICQIEEIIIKFSIFSLINDSVSIHSVDIENGNVSLVKDEKGKFEIVENFKSDAHEIDEGKEKVDEGPLAVFQLLPKNINIKNITLEYSDKQIKTNHNIKIDTLDLKFSKSDLVIETILEMALDGNEISLQSDSYLTNNNWDLSSVRTKSHISFLNFKPSQVADFTSIFYLSDFKDTSLDEDNLSIHLDSLKLQGIKTKNKMELPALEVSFFLDYAIKNSHLEIKNFNLLSNEDTSVGLKGFLKQSEDNRIIELNITSEKLNVDKLMPLVQNLSKVELQRSVYFANNPSSSEKNVPNTENAKKIKIKNDILITLDLKKTIYNKTNITYVRGPIELKDDKILLKDFIIGVFDGQVKNNGHFDLITKKIHIVSNLSGINSEKALSFVTRDKLIKGTLYGNVSTDLNVNNPQSIGRSLILHSKFKIVKGQLLGYANFIKPVAEIGKILNYNGPKGESTGFESIVGNVTVKNKDVYLNQFEMTGVGLNATGSGVYGNSGKMNLKFTVALSGFVGKAVKLPILYKGIYGKNVAYIDPVWLASVYTGTLLFGGPAGALLGGIAGSTASDTVDKTIGTVKDTFGGIKGYLFGDKK